MKKNAFTLFELMVVIALIGIIFLGVSKLNFKNISDRQRLQGFFYKVKTEIETIQTNALMGKAIHYDNGPNSGMIVPDYWKINFVNDGNSGSGKIITQYSSGGTLYEFHKLVPEKSYSIKVYNSGITIGAHTGSILIQSGNLTLTGITTKNKTLELKINYKQFTKELFINTISGVIEEK